VEHLNTPALLRMDEIEKAVDSFKPKRSAGPDEIPLLIFKDSFPVICNQVMKLFNICFCSRMIPPEWKTARPKPIFEKGDPKSAKNYRPISNLNLHTKHVFFTDLIMMT